MHQTGMARAYGKLTVRERLQAMSQAAARDDFREAKRMMKAGPVGPLAHVERAFRETVIRFALGLNGRLVQRQCLTGIADLLPAMLVGSSERALPEKLLSEPVQVLQESEEAIHQWCSSYLQAVDVFCRQIGGISATEALRLYLPGLARDLEGSGIQAQHTADDEEQVARLVEQMLRTWRVLMGR